MTGRPKQDGPRHECGKLVQAKEPPERLIDRRNILVGGFRDPERPKSQVDPRDGRASYALGILFLRGSITKADHQAGLEYAAAYHTVFGRGAPRSHFAHLVPGAGKPPSDKAVADAAEKLGTANAALFALNTRRPYHVLLNIAVYDRPMRFMDTARARTPAAWAADQRDLEALQEATDALAKLWRMGHYTPKRAAD